MRDFHSLNPLKQKLFLWAKDQDAACSALAMSHADGRIELVSLAGYFDDHFWKTRVNRILEQGFRRIALVRQGRVEPLTECSPEILDCVRAAYATWEKRGTE